MSNRPPPPPKPARSFAQMRAQVKKLEEDNARLKAIQDEKEQPDHSTIAKKNPNRTNPLPSGPKISLFNYATDWIEQERSNVTVELNTNFEDETLKSHSVILENDNLSMLGMDKPKIKEVVKTYESYSVLNLAYRLLITLPVSYRLEAKTLIDAIKNDDVPKNTPVINEMLSHIGKTKTNSFGNLRIKYPLQLAKKKILKAMINLEDVPYFQENLQMEDDATFKDLKDNWLTGFFLDKDAPDFLAAEAMKYLDLRADSILDFELDNVQYSLMMPDRFKETHTHNGRYSPTPQFVFNWLKGIKLFKPTMENLYWTMGCAMIMQMVNLRFLKGNITLSTFNSDFTNTDWADFTWETISGYLGIVVLDNYVSTEKLAINYFMIIDYYRSIAEKHVNTVFKTSPVKKDEFGTEAQMIICPKWDKDKNNSVDCSFKIDDKNKAVAAGVFNFTNSVVYSSNDRMYLKNSFRSIISNLVNSFSRK